MRFFLTSDDPKSKARALTLSKKLNIEIFKKPPQKQIKEFSEDYFFTCSKGRLFLKKGLRQNSKPIFSDFDDWAKNYDDNLLKNSTKGLPANFSCLNLTAGFGKDASGYIMTRPSTWIWPAVNGNRESPTAFNLLVNLPDRRLSFGEEGITDVYMTTGKTSLYSLMGMMSSTTVRQMFGAGSEMVPLEFHCIEPGLDEWIASASDEDKYARLFEVCATLGYMLTDPGIGSLGGAAKRRRLLIYPRDQGNLLTCVNASQVADHALKSNYESTVFTKLDQADFMNRVTRRFKAYADLVAASEVAQGSRWISQADFHDGEKKQIGPNVHSILSVRGYDVMSMDEYIQTFNDISAAPDRLMRRCIQSIATNAPQKVDIIIHS